MFIKNIMQQKNFSFLNEHFVFETFQVESHYRFKELVNQDLQKRKIDLKDYNFINTFYEKDTDHLITFDISTRADFNNAWLEFYLKQLPSLALSDIRYMFAMGNTNNQLLPNAFKIPADYPSEFCREFLKDTYGRVVYTWQFMELLSCCLLGEENSHKQLDEYRRWYNNRMAKVFPLIEQLNLPDGYNLNKLLREFTPLRPVDSEYGFVIRPLEYHPWDFIQRAKKYI